MKEVLIMSLIGLIAGLGGCQPNDKPPMTVKENPPPKPPNCPDLPELANLRLKDGRVANVRIFQDGDEKFYIPYSWFEWEAHRYSPQTNVIREFNDNYRSLLGSERETFFKLQKEVAVKAYWDEKPFGRYKPDLDQIECPGVVHFGEFNYTTPLNRTNMLDKSYQVSPNFDEGEIERAKFYHIHPERYYPNWMPGYEGKVRSPAQLHDEDIDQSAFSAKIYIRMSHRIMATYEHFPYDVIIERQWKEGTGNWETYKKRAMASKKWQVWRKSVNELYAWLKTSPTNRDNERIFKLGIEQK